MSNFVVSARKYRPARFDEVVGQQHVSQTLKNALQNDHLAHAFLFCGPRGVGKTTCARILAKVINCENLGDDHEACDNCSSCTAFNENASFNITELDAASNNSVEHIRALIEQVRFQPQQGQYKVFIIDEVHMLSQQAFNAFLKTLEEPPPYAIFILATTEKHKIIPTILSRCQIFDFRRIQVSDMVSHLESICKQEGITADRDALHVIGQKADGALRDSLSIFDRIVSFSGKQINYQDVIDNLNVLDYDYFFKIVDAMLVEDMAAVLLSFDDILKKGFESDIFIHGLAEHLRNLLVCKDEQTLSLLEVSGSLKTRYQEQAHISPSAFLLTALNICNDCDVNYKMARHKRLHVEMALVKMVHINRAVQLTQMPALSPVEKKTLEQNSISPQNPKSPPTVAPAVATPNSPPPPSATPPMGGDPAPVEKPKTTPPPSPEVQTSEALKQSPIPASVKKGMPLNLKALYEEVDQQMPTERDRREQQLNLEEVQQAWKAFSEQVNSPSVRNTMNNTVLKVVNNTLIAVVGSNLAKGMIQEEDELMPFMRKQLKYSSLGMEFEIDESKRPQAVKKPKKSLTTKEKYDLMKQKNPLIEEMRKRFDLKIDPDA